VDAKTATDILTIVGLIVSLIGGALGAFSIIVTWKLYQAGNSVNLETLKLLHQVSTSSHTTEVTSTHYTERLVTGLLELTQKGMRYNLEWGLSSVTKRVEAALNEKLGDINPELAAQIKGRVLKDLSDTFRTLEYEAAAIGQVPESELPQSGPTQKQSTMLAPGVPRLLQWIVKHQSRYEFLSVKFLREKLFASDPPLQEALQFCIDRGMLELYDRPNPHGRTTKACRLNLEHPLTQQLFEPPHGD
jgi:hypothetical protein